MAKTPGLLGRKKSNFEPTVPYISGGEPVESKNNEHTPAVETKSEQKQVTPKEKKKFKNQQGSIKISSQSKEELEALMKLTNTKYVHEIIDLLIDRYVENELTSAQKRKFKLLTEI